MIRIDDPSNVCACVRACVRACDCLVVCLSVCLPVASHISETSEAIAIKFDKVTASVMTMHHASIFNSLRLDLWPHEHVLQNTGQCMLSERAFGVETSK